MAQHKAPAFQFYAGDFLADDNVCLMTNEQVGAYVLLLCHQWARPEGLPEALSSLAKLARCTTARFERVIWPAIVPCFRQNEDRHWFNARMERVRTEQEAFFERQRAAGRASAAVRTKRQPEDNHGSIPVPTEPQPEPQPLVNSSSSSSSSKERETLPDASEGHEIAAVADFLEGFRQRYQKVTGASLPLVSSHKELGIAARLLKTWPKDRLLDMAEIFFYRNDKQVQGLPKTLPFFEPMAPWCDAQMAGVGR